MTQKQIIIKQLNETGEVTRNWCLQRYISRLSGLILVLKREGWDFEEGEYIKNGQGKDYRYKTKKSPYRKVLYKLENGRQFIAYEK